ncbi:floral homeotic protein DEFICIENS isoform X2 [Morus notabilis]|uniref:floral homeotic protein DEFICIENS isoform X2 n=1 Tax=Morus notabilis TaxID=981085 RepID=UPI000CED35C3|nr:floral homeotic protein DEFICIENS isoform X2 [Morus notabilis]
MARRKIQIKRIENITNRIITYAKRRNGLFKMAQELTVLYNAKVSIIIISGNGRLHEYISASTTRKQILDLYQKTKGIDLWSSHYERMEERLKELKVTNRSLQKQISHRKGESLSNLSFDELLALDREMEDALEALRTRKMKCQVDTCRKKLRFLEQTSEDLRSGFNGALDDPHYGVVDNGGVYDYGIPRAFASGLHRNQLALDTETKSLLTTCSDYISEFSVNQSNLDDQTESAAHTSS